MITVFKSQRLLPVSGQDEHSAENPNIVADQLHLVPELHLAVVVPVSEVSVDEQDDQRKDGGQDLSGHPDVVPSEEGQS